MEKGVAPWRRPWDGTAVATHVKLDLGSRYAAPIRSCSRSACTSGIALPFWFAAFAEAKSSDLPPQGSKAVQFLRPRAQNREEAGVA